MNVDEASGSSETQPQDLDDYLSEIYAVTDALEEFVNAELAYFNQMRVFIDARAIFLSSCRLRIYQIRDSARIFLENLAASYHDTTPISRHIRTSLHKPLQPPPLDEAGDFRMSQEFRDSVQAASCAGQSANKLFRENHDFLSFRHTDTWPSILLPIADMMSLGSDRDTSLITTAMERLFHTYWMKC